MLHPYAALGAALVLAFSTSTVFAQWEPVGPAQFSPGMTDYNAVAMAPDDRPAVVFTDWSRQMKLTAMRYTGSSWETWGNAGFGAASLLALTMAIDGAGTPYVAYRDLGNDLRITVMRLNGDTWEGVGTSGPSAGAGHFPSLAFDAADVPYIAFRDVPQQNRLTVKRFVSGAWETVGTEGFSELAVSVTDLRFNSTGIPYVAIDANTAGSRVYRLAGDTWEQVGTTASLYNSRIAAMALDAQDVPHIAYFDMSNSGAATVKKLVGDTWTVVGGAASTEDESPQLLKMAVHTDGSIYVVFSDADLTMRLTARKWTDGAWSTVGSAGFTATLASNIGLVLDSNGVPHVGLKDATNGVGKATVLRYQEGTNSVDEMDVATIQLLPNPANEQVMLTGLPVRAQVTVLDLAGKVVLSTTEAATNHAIGTHTLPNGVYVVQVRSASGRQQQRLVVAH